MSYYLRPAVKTDEKWIKAKGMENSEETYILMSFLKPVGLMVASKESTPHFVVEEGYEDDHLEQRMQALYEKDYKKTDGPSAFLLKKREREASFEILRVFAMLMVITLHYLDKGGILKDTTEKLAFGDHISWALEALCLTGVNVYVLIGAYFLTSKKFRLTRIVSLWCEVFFYSVLIAAIGLLTGIADPEQYFNLFNIQFFLLPGINQHYWFASAYIVMLFFSPLLNKAIDTLTKRQYETVMLCLLGLFCLVTTLSPYELPIDDSGNSFVWFLVLYLIAGYIKKYGIKGMEDRALFLFLAFVGLEYVAILATGLFVKAYPAFEHAKTTVLHYNYAFVFLASLSLFLFVKKHPVKRNPFVNFITRIAPYTFGVYLIHEHLMLRYTWPKWLHTEGQYGFYRPLHLILSVLLVFSVCVLIDLLRSLLFKALDRFICWGLKLYFKMKETFDYLIVGGITTVANWLAYVACAYLIFASLLAGQDTARIMISNVIAWVVAVVLAYFLNRNFVFHSEITDAKGKWKEFSAFLSARIFSFVIEQGFMYLFVDLLKISDLISKLVIGIIVIILNYIFSKLWIFKKKS